MGLGFSVDGTEFNSIQWLMVFVVCGVTPSWFFDWGKTNILILLKTLYDFNIV